MLVKKKLFLSIALILAIFLCIIVSIPKINRVAYAGEGEVILNSNAFVFVPNGKLDTNLYAKGNNDNDNYKDDEGATIRVSLTEDQVAEIDEIKYFFVKIEDASDSISRGEDNGETYKNGVLIKSEDVIGEQKYTAVINKYSSSTINMDSYFEVTAYQWCALVVDIKYHSGTEINWSYNDSNINYITNIDNSAPKAYKSNPVYKDGGYIFNINIEDKDTQSITANSGIKSIDIRKETSVGEEILKFEDNINDNTYLYKLEISSEKAQYYAYLTDYVGNNSKILLVSVGNSSYNDGFESALNNDYNDFKSVKDEYSVSSYDAFEKAYFDYYLLVQDYSNASTVEDRQEIENNIIRQMTTVQALRNDFTKSEKLRLEGKKNIQIIVANGEYLKGDIEFLNISEAYSTLLYGETAVFNISIADFDLNKVDKTAEISESGLKNVSSVIGLTFNTNKVITGDEDITFTVPLKIKLPIGDYKKVSCVMAVVDNEGNTTYTNLSIVEYTSYIVVNMPQSKGVITIVLAEDNNKNLLWLLTLLIIPIGIGAYCVIILFKKKNAQKKIEKDIETKRIIDEKNANAIKNKIQNAKNKKKK